MTEVKDIIGVKPSAVEVDDIAWPDGYGFPTYANARAALLALGYRFKFDIFANRKTYRDPETGKSKRISRRTLPRLRQLIRERYGFDVRKEPLADAIDELCYANSHHPVKAYYRRLKWDGKARLDTWLIDYLGAEDSALNRAIGPLTLIASVRRIRKPGTPYDLILTLVGKTGTKKSSAARALAVRAGWYSDSDLIGLAHDRQIEQIDGVVIYELPDLAGYSRSNVQKFKAFISRVEDRLRRPYERERDDRRRSTIFIATVDRDDFLLDQAGNRRFVVVKIGKVLLRKLKRDVDQLWAEACHREKEFGDLELPPSLWSASEELQRQHMRFEPWDDELRPLKAVPIKDGMFVPNALIHEVLTLKGVTLTPDAHVRIAGSMALLGYVRSGPTKFNGKTVRGFIRPFTDQEKEEKQ